MKLIFHKQIDVRAIAKPRPRFKVTQKGQVWTYTPANCKKFEQVIADTVDVKVKGSSSVMLEVYFFFKSYSKRLWGKRHNKRPDLDNLVKSVMDGLQQGGFYADDAIVTELLASKFYHEKNLVEIKAWDNEQ